MTKAAINAIQEQNQGGHADEIETSIMLAINPASIQMERAEPGLEEVTKGVLNPSDPAGLNYCPNGATGNPTLANPEEGGQILTAMLKDIYAHLESVNRNQTKKSEPT